MGDKITVCKRCVMDSTDPTIKFDENGYCNYCNYALATQDKRWLNTQEGWVKLNNLISKIKEENKHKKYDCMIGLSGGLDSSYLAYISKKYFDLRLLALHVDTGWNTKISENNIRKICNKMGIDLIVEKLNPREFMDLQRSYFLSGVPSQDNPQDHVFIALLFQYAKNNGIKYFLSGANFSTECILQKGNSYIAADKVNLRDIHRNFGKIDIKTLPTISLFDRYIKFRFINRIKMIRPLDYIDYRLKDAIEELEKEVGFVYYGGKHYESAFTKFYQEYYLPRKYHYDKRKSHLSSLIVTGQITRQEALDELKKPLYNELQMERDIKYILDKIDITREEFNEIMSAQPTSNYNFKVSKWTKFYGLAVRFRRIFGE